MFQQRWTKRHEADQPAVASITPSHADQVMLAITERAALDRELRQLSERNNKS